MKKNYFRRILLRHREGARPEGLERYIDENFISFNAHVRIDAAVDYADSSRVDAPLWEERPPIGSVCCAPAPAAVPFSAKPAFRLDESFSQRLQRLLAEKDMTAPECYRRANMDRKLFSKICSSRDYRPKKNTVLSLAVALRLSLEETRELLESAGYALSHSILSDVIVEFYISQGYYDIFGINEELFKYDQALLGS